MEKETTISFFGDAQLTANEPLIYFPNAKVACDYTDCGRYIASKHLDIDKPTCTTLPKLISLLSVVYERVKVVAWNNGIAHFFRRENIETLQDLADYFSKKLECPYP